MHTENIQPIINRVPVWQDADDIQYKRAGGLTNANYRIIVNGESFMLRISGPNTQSLGINRQNELAALQAAAAAGIGPEVVAFLEPEGHLVTRWVDGYHWDADEYRTPENVRLMAHTIQQIHRLPIRGKARSSMSQRVADYVKNARGLNAPLPGNFDTFLANVDAIETDQRSDSSDWQRFCHNDLASCNYLIHKDEKRITVLDWEFAGLNDIYFDLAYAIYTHDDDGPIPPELEELLLTTYFGEVTDFQRRRLLGMKYIRTLYNTLWGFTQGAMQRAGLIPTVEWFDYWAFAENLIANELRELHERYNQS